MSNTSTVTPYESSQGSQVGAGSLVGACIAGAVVGTVQVARWLVEKTPEDMATLEQFEQTRRRELITCGMPTAAALPADVLRVASVTLRHRDVEGVVRAAESLGWRHTRIGAIDAAPGTMTLVGPCQERLAITRGADGRVALHSAGSTRLAHAVVQRDTLVRAANHLRAKDTRLQLSATPNGEYELRATLGGVSAPATPVQAIVHRDGDVTIDVDCRGPICEDIVKDLANAIGGGVKETKRKPSYYQRPGEAAKLRVGG